MKRLLDNQTQSIGLHFERNRIFGTRLRAEQAGVEIESASRVSFKGALGDTGSVDALQSLMKELAPPKGCFINVTTAFEQFNTTHLAIGDTPLAQMNKMAQMAYLQEIQPGDDAFIFDYERVGVNSESITPKINIHAFSVETSLKETLCKLVADAGYKTHAIFHQLFALRNLVATKEQEAPTALLILDDNELRIGVIQNQKYIFTRTFKSGQEAFLQYISQKVSKPITSPELIKALDKDSEVYHSQLAMEVRSAFSFITERMQQQIDRAFKFYTGRLKLPPVERILIYADSGIVARKMASLMKTSYNHPVSYLNVEELDSIETDKAFQLNDDTFCYNLAIGAAMASFQHCPNLLHTHFDQQQQRKTYRIKTAVMLTLSAMVLICLISFALQVVLITPQLIKKRSLERQSAANPTYHSKEIIRMKTTLCKNRMGDLNHLAEHYSLQGFFYEISSLLPPELKLEHLQLEMNEEYEKETGAIGSLKLQGIVLDHGLRQQAYLTKFLVELGNSPAFRNIKKIPISTSEMEIYTELEILPFRISCDLIYGVAAKGETP